MKKYLSSLLLTFLFVTLSHFAVQAQIHVGTGASFATQLDDVGLNIRLQVDIADVGDGRLAAVPNVTYYFVGQGFTWLEINGDFTYMLGDPDVIVGYPIIGGRYDMNITSFLGQSQTVGNVGLNTGLGTQYSIGDNLKVYLEGKYLFGVFNRFVFGIGVMVGI
mgnify:CR=1 FL=1